MSYQAALEAAGATVHKFAEFGDYQGQWWAKVTHKGVTGWVSGSYGSCSGCDAFQAEFGYSEGQCDEHLYVYPPVEGCTDCASVKADYDVRLKKFGENYLGAMMTQAEAEKEAMPSWKDWQDEDDTKVVNFLKENALEG